MAQQSDVSLANQGFADFRSELNSILAAFNTSHSGSSRPSSAVAGSFWLDTTSATAPILKHYDGSDDITVMTFNYSANTVDMTDSSVTYDIVNDTSPQLGGALDGQDNIVSKVNLKDFGMVTNALGDLGGGTDNIDLSAGNSITATVSTSAETITISNPTASDENCSFIIKFVNAGSQTLNLPASFKFAGGTAPSWTTSGTDILVGTTWDGGTTYHCSTYSLDSK
jgi:hypothetical protein